MFKNFPKEQLKEDQIIPDACKYLDVGEFQLFQLGYRAWYGKEAKIRYLDKCFVLYMKDGETPFWARHFARNIVKLGKVGNLNIQNREYCVYENDGQDNISEPDYGVLLLMGMIMIIFVSAIVAA